MQSQNCNCKIQEMGYNQMKKILITMALFAAMLPAVQAAQEIPLKAFSKLPEFTTVQISPDGKHLAVTAEVGNETRAVVMDTQTKEIKSVFAFGDNTHVSRIYWANPERILMQITVKLGSLDFRMGTYELFAANIDGSNRKRVFAPGYRIVDLLESDPKHILVARSWGTRGNEGKIHVMKLDIYTKRMSRYAVGVESTTGLTFDRSGQPRFAYGSDIDGVFRVYHRPEDKWNLLLTSNERTSEFRPVAFNADNSKAWVRSDRNSDTVGYDLLDLKTGEVTTVFRDDVADIEETIHDPKTDEVVGVMTMPGKRKYTFFNEEHPVTIMYRMLLKAFPGQKVAITSYTNDYKTGIIQVSSDRNPSDFYLMNMETRQAQYLMSSRSWIDPEQMAAVEPITVTARDGLQLHGYLTVPNGVEPRNLPTVVMVHGGPHGPRDEWGFDPDVQAIASRGYAVLQINFRGSGGYGNVFLTTGYRKWGREMQDDVTDATLWAVEQGIADPERLCIYGGSYGGYAALMGVVREPDLYKCALGYVGVYDLKLMHRDGDIPDSKYGRAYLDRALGNDSEDLEARSPAYNVDRIKADLLIVSGGKDERVPLSQAKKLRRMLDRAGKTYGWHVEKKEGHGFADEENRLRFYEMMMEFFDRNIGDGTVAETEVTQQ